MKKNINKYVNTHKKREIELLHMRWFSEEHCCLTASRFLVRVPAETGLSEWSLHVLRVLLWILHTIQTHAAQVMSVFVLTL